MDERQKVCWKKLVKCVSVHIIAQLVFQTWKYVNKTACKLHVMWRHVTQKNLRAYR